MGGPGLKIFLIAWLPAWAIVVFGSSAILAWQGLAPGAIGTGPEALFRGVWPVADLVSPAAKLLIGGALLAGFLLIAQRRPSRAAAMLLGSGVGVVAVSTALAVLPETLSRGFGLGLTGLRFDPSLLPAYLVAAVLGGAYFGLVLTRR